MNVTRRAVISGGLAVLAVPRARAAGDDGFITVHAGPATSDLPWAGQSKLLGYDGVIPGPVIRGRQGEPLRIRLVNGLDAPTALHWHGVRLSNAMDGSPLTQDPVPPGGSFDYLFTPPDAGTFWYHSLFDGARQRERGLHGMLVIEERAPDPQLFDVPVIVDDWRIDAGGALDEAAFGDAALASGEGRLGTRFTVNGQVLPTIPLEPGRLTRLRILNAANARHFRLSLDAAEASAIAFDGQPYAPMPLRGPLSLAPGQRADVIAMSAGGRFSLASLDGTRSVPLAHFAADDDGRTPGGVFPVLPANAVADYFNVSAVMDVTYTIEGGLNSRLSEARLDGIMRPMDELRRRGLHFAVNGSAGLGPEPLFRARAGVTAAVTVDNITRVPHVLHIHGHAAWLIERGGRRLDRPVWHDTFVANPLEPVKVLFIADNPGRWLIASAVAEHFAAGCQAWFEVLP